MEKLYKEHLKSVCKNFDAMLNKYDYEEIVLYSGEVRSVYLDDNPYTFKADFNFLYLIPLLNYPNSFVKYKSGSKPALYLFQKDNFWDAPPKEIDNFYNDYFKIHYFSDMSKLSKYFKYNLNHTVLLAKETARFTSLGFKTINDGNIINSIAYQRSFKTSYEVKCIKKANKLAAKAHIKAKDSFYAGESEIQTHFSYLKAINYKESEVPYTNIVAYDENCAVLHYTDYNTKKVNAKSFLIDAGASYNAYHSDITRTYAKDKNSEFQELINVVNDSTLNIISKIKINLNYEELQEEMHKNLSQILFDFKLMNISADEIYSRGYSKVFNPAGVGHYLGLQVHDVGNTTKNKNGKIISKSKKHPFLRLRRDIEVGNVFTIEPGIYIIEQLLNPHYGNNKFNWNNINKLKPYGGVRVEDNISVQKNCIVNLTRKYLK